MFLRLFGMPDERFLSSLIIKKGSAPAFADGHRGFKTEVNTTRTKKL